MLSREYERPGMIKLDRVKEFFAEIGVTGKDMIQLTLQLEPLCDQDGYFNFEQFVSSAF